MIQTMIRFKVDVV